MKRGFGPTGISAITLLVAGWITLTTLLAVLETQTRLYPKTAVKESGGTRISAVISLVAGSMRDTRPLGSLGIHAEPAPKAMPPSLLAGPTGTFASTWLVVRSTR